MNLELDLTLPTIVIVGAWNPAILQNPGWLARHLLGYPEGATVKLGTAQPEGLGKTVLLFESIALCNNGARLEITPNTIENCEVLYRVMRRVTEVLPHTPIQSIGCNFNFKIKEDLAEIGQLIQTEEMIDTIGKIIQSERLETILLEENVALNLKRVVNENGGVIDFNFTQDIAKFDDIAALIDTDFVGKYYSRAKDILKEFYNLDDVSFSAFALPEDPK